MFLQPDFVLNMSDKAKTCFNEVFGKQVFNIISESVSVSGRNSPTRRVLDENIPAKNRIANVSRMNSSNSRIGMGATFIS